MALTLDLETLFFEALNTS